MKIAQNFIVMNLSKRVQPFSNDGWQCHVIKDVTITAHVGTEQKAWDILLMGAICYALSQDMWC